MLAVLPPYDTFEAILPKGPTVTDLTGSALADALRDRYVLQRELRVRGVAVVWLTWDETAHNTSGCGRARPRTRLANERLGRCACV